MPKTRPAQKAGSAVGYVVATTDCYGNTDSFLCSTLKQARETYAHEVERDRVMSARIFAYGPDKKLAHVD